MNVVDDRATEYCTRHPRIETRVQCSKCGIPICTRCMVQTPVGARCSACAQLRRLPQRDVGWVRLGRSLLMGAGASVLGWYIASYVPYLRFFVGLAVGAAVGEVMSRSSERRSNLLLEAAAVVAVVGGLVLVGLTERALDISTPWRFGTGGTSALSAFVVLPAIVASTVAVIKLR